MATQVLNKGRSEFNRFNTSTPATSAGTGTTTSRCLFSSTLKDLNDVASASRTFSTVMNDFSIHLEPFLNHIDESVCQATHTFNANSVDKIQHLRRALVTATAAQDAAFNKRALIKTKSTDVNTIQQKEGQIIQKMVAIGSN